MLRIANLLKPVVSVSLTMEKWTNVATAPPNMPREPLSQMKRPPQWNEDDCRYLRILSVDKKVRYLQDTWLNENVTCRIV